MQLFTGLFTVFTLVIALRGNADELVVSCKAVLIGIAAIAAVFTATDLLSAKQQQKKHRQGLSLMSFAVSILAVYLALCVLIARVDKGIIWWLELVVAVTNVFWIWRMAQQSLRGDSS